MENYEVTRVNSIAMTLSSIVDALYAIFIAKRNGDKKKIEALSGGEGGVAKVITRLKMFAIQIL